MSEAKRLLALCEGDDDRRVLKGLVDSKLLPELLDVAKKAPEDRSGGWSTLAKETVDIVRGGLSVVAFRDLDDLTGTQCVAWMQDVLMQASIDSTVLAGERAWGVLRVMSGPSVGIVGVGRPNGAESIGIPDINRSTIDDYVLSLAADPAVYDSLTDVRGVQFVAFDIVAKKLPRIVNLLRDNGVVIRDSKRLLQIFRGITGFRASPAEFAERLLDVASKLEDADARLRKLFSPLLEDTAAAVAAMHVDST